MSSQKSESDIQSVILQTIISLNSLHSFKTVTQGTFCGGGGGFFIRE